MKRYVVTLIVLVGSVVVLWGCGATQPSRFYVLSALPEAETQGSARKSGPVIGVGPVEIAGYLDRPQIVTRASRNQLDLGEFDKWAEPLGENIARVVGENLSIMLGTDRVLVYPYGATPVQYQVEMQVTRFDGNPSGDVLLVVHWRVFGADDRQVLVSRKSRLTAPANRFDYEELVAAMSQNLAELSREITSAIQNI